MKTDLQVSGRAELTHDDVTKAIIEYLGNHFNYKVDKVIYPNQVITAIAQISGTTTPREEVPCFEVKQKQVREQHSSRKMENIGVFDTMRSILNEMFIKNDRKETLIQYKQFREDVMFFFPKMDDAKLRIYLGDKRQFGSNMIWNTKQNHIVVRSIINH